MHKQQMLVLIAIAALGALFQARPAQAQAGQDTATKLIDVKIGPENIWQPVWITKVVIGDQFLLNPPNPFVTLLPGQVSPNQDFIAGDNWLKDTTLYVINRTDQPIAWLSISFEFPQTGNGQTQPVWVYHLRLGRLPDAVAITGSGQPVPPGPPGSTFLDLQSGARLTIHVSDYTDKIQDYLKTAMPLSAINEVYVRVDSCVFEDGLRFDGDNYSRPDPQRPGKWVYLPNRQFFPGNIHTYLPNVQTRAGVPPQQ